MTGLWTGNHTTAVVTSNAFRGVPGAQSLAIGIAAASLAIAQAVQPALGHSVYLICAPGVLACAATGGWLTAACGGLLVAGGGALVEKFAGIPRAETALQAGLFLTAGLGFATWMLRRGRPPQTLSGPALPEVTPGPRAGLDLALLSELSQPLSAVANYVGAARNMIARLELEDDELLDVVTRASEQMSRVDGLLETLSVREIPDRHMPDT